MAKQTINKLILKLTVLTAIVCATTVQAKDAKAPLPPQPAPVLTVPGIPTTTPATAPAQTQAPSGAPDPASINTLKMFKAAGADINYLGRLYGLDGWLITKDTAVEVVYTTPDGQASIVGLLYGPDGTLATENQLQEAKDKGLVMPNTTAGKPSPDGQAAPSTGASPGERLWSDVQASNYITVGAKTAPVLYIFVDPRCHFCQGYWQTLTAQALPQNQVQLRLIPVGILGPDSEMLAEKVMSAPDKAVAWSQIEDMNYSTLPTTIVPDAAGKLQANRDLMAKYGFNGTPYSVYRSKDGKVKIVYGVPSNVAQVISDIAPN